MNWHLFETITVVKYATGDTLDLSLTPLAARPLNPSIYCSEQLDIPGVPKPNRSRRPRINVTVGTILGTRIGYIYGYAWRDSADSEFLQAVRTVMFDNDTIGLIIDFRLNSGGDMSLSNDALAVLFNETVATIGVAVRRSPNDHLTMKPLGYGPFPNGLAPTFVIQGDPATFYDRPIAVLVGPGAVSSGDQVALRMTFHPMARTFGKSTATAFSSPEPVNLTHSDWEARFAWTDAYLLSDPTNYLTHDEFVVDEPVWLEPDDVARGLDTVVEAAMAWIRQSAPVATDDVEPFTTHLAPNYPNPFPKQTTIVFEVPTTQRTTLTVYDVLGREAAVLVDGLMPAGTHRVRFDGGTLAPGVYFYQIRTGAFVETQEMMVVR